MSLQSPQDYAFFIIIIVETVIIIAALIWHYLSSDDDLQLIQPYEQKINNLKSELNSIRKSLHNYENALAQANTRLNQWNNWYEQNKHLLARSEEKSNVIEFDLSQKAKQQAYIKQIQYQYFEDANGGKFLRLLSTPEKCNFRTWEEGGVRKFEFCGNVAKALANINAIFDDVCEIEGKRNGATDIENVTAGTLDSELRITSKAKIRLK